MYMKKTKTTETITWWDHNLEAWTRRIYYKNGTPPKQEYQWDYNVWIPLNEWKNKFKYYQLLGGGI